MCVCVCARGPGVVPEPADEVEEKARGGDGDGQEEAGLRDRAAEGKFGQRGRGRRLQQTSGPELRRREDHTAAEETQTGPAAAAARSRHRQLLTALRPPPPPPPPLLLLWFLMDTNRTVGVCRTFFDFCVVSFFFSCTLMEARDRTQRGGDVTGDLTCK